MWKHDKFLREKRDHTNYDEAWWIESASGLSLGFIMKNIFHDRFVVVPDECVVGDKGYSFDMTVSDKELEEQGFFVFSDLEEAKTYYLMRCT